MKAARCVLAVVVASHVTVIADAQPSQSAVQRAESEMWTRIEERARRLGAFTLDSSEFDLRIPLVGEPEEVIGVTRLTSTARVVGTARLEPLDSIGSRSEQFRSGRYDLRIEDRAGNCVLVHQVVSVDSALTRGVRTSETCQPLYMAEVVRRSRRIARLPISAGKLTDNWTASPALTGRVDVHLDSIVVVATTLALQANPRGGETAARVDSITIGLAVGQSSWHIVHRSRPVVVDTVLRRGERWTRANLRFVIPIDSTFALRTSWPVLEVSLSVTRTESNPYGTAWTYAHGAQGYFRNVRWPESNKRPQQSPASGTESPGSELPSSHRRHR